MAASFQALAEPTRLQILNLLRFGERNGLAAPLTSAGDDADAGLATVAVTAISGAQATSVDGVVQAVRQTVLASQVAGAVVSLDARAGSRVRAGQAESGTD